MAENPAPLSPASPKDTISKMNILMLGPDSTDTKKATKTLILDQFKRDIGTKSKIDFILTTSRVPLNCSEISIKTQIWDVICADRFKSLSESFFPAAHIHLYFYEPNLQMTVSEEIVIEYIKEETIRFKAKDKKAQDTGQPTLNTMYSIKDANALSTPPQLTECVGIKDYFSLKSHKDAIRLLVLVYKSDEVTHPNDLIYWQKLNEFWSKLHQFDDTLMFDQTCVNSRVNSTPATDPFMSSHNQDFFSVSPLTSTQGLAVEMNRSALELNTGQQLTPSPQPTPNFLASAYLYDGQNTPAYMQLINLSCEKFINKQTAKGSRHDSECDSNDSDAEDSSNDDTDESDNSDTESGFKMKKKEKCNIM